MPAAHVIGASDTPSCGYLGFTSFLAIYEETCDALSPHQPQLDFGSSKRDQPVKDSEPKTPNLSDASLQAGLDVLQCIPRRQEAVALLDYHFNAYDAWIHPLARLMLDSLYDTFGHIFEPPECSKDLLTGLALVLGKNTSKVFCEDEPDSRRWISQFVGANIRWETLGVLFTYWEFGARSINTRSGTSDIQKTSLKPAAVFRKSIESCLSLARAGTKTGNTMLVYIYYKRGIIDSVISGDASLSYWQNHAETVAILSFLGLHIATLSPEQPYKPTLSSEIRRRIFCHVFISDKGASSFTGRPPLLSGKYTSTPLPLDLRGEYLLSDEAMLAREVATLDEQGWSKSNNVNSISSLRARFCFSVICDEIFEIALAVMAFAVPGGGVLCLELLKPTDSHISNPDRDPRPSRSAIIQQLSLLVGFLSWVKPSASNGDLCADCKVVIQHVLNRALNDPAGVHTGAIDVSDWNISTRIGYEFDLLDTFDWLRADLS
ncbi:uncharacterized protein CTRU02_201069 [Colletotrichum truncatum]|uniref:Uncharacterized protein n=1 Tax=Colletotrichum truncatum TaxID=5467 RepID=A0ACC3ZH63_COLTU